jgi:hypothetical protein
MLNCKYNEIEHNYTAPPNAQQNSMLLTLTMPQHKRNIFTQNEKVHNVKAYSIGAVAITY